MGKLNDLPGDPVDPQEPAADPNVDPAADPNAEPTGDDPSADPSGQDDPSADPSSDPWAEFIGEGKRFADIPAVFKAIEEKDRATTQAQQEAAQLRKVLQYAASQLSRPAMPNEPAGPTAEQLQAMYEQDPVAANRAAGFLTKDDIQDLRARADRSERALSAMSLAMTLDEFPELKPVAQFFRANASADEIIPPAGLSPMWDRMNTIFASSPALHNVGLTAIVPMLYQVARAQSGNGNGTPPGKNAPVSPVGNRRKANASTANAGAGGAAGAGDEPDYSDPKIWTPAKMEADLKKRGLWK